MNHSQIAPDENELQAALEGRWPEVELLWPRFLARILAAVRSPARTMEMTEALRNDPWFKRTARDWEGWDIEARRTRWEELTGRLIRAAYATRPHCIGCGQCCASGAPALLAVEAELVGPGGVFFEKAYTIRIGEPVVDRQAGGVGLAETELIKPLDPGGTCFFYEPGRGCRVYSQRPAQCRRLSCWEELDGAAEFKGPFLSRAQALAGRGMMEDYAQAHQLRCPSQEIVPLAKAALDDDREAAARLEEMIAFDLHTRIFAQDKGHLSPDELDLVLGRPLAVILEPLGLKTWEIQGRIRLRQSS